MTSLSSTDAQRSLAVLGLLANSEIVAFSRLAAEAALAPTLGQRLELCRIGRVGLGRLEQIEARVRELGGDLEQTVAPFVDTFAPLDDHIPASSWWEGLLTAYVGYGVEDDFARMLSESLDAPTRTLVQDALGDDGHASLVIATLSAATRQDVALASRLALWGRRLVGEALGVVQRVLVDHPQLKELLGAWMGEENLQQRLFSVLTTEHSRRMERLGLTP